jgi:hypothetical protein
LLSATQFDNRSHNDDDVDEEREEAPLEIF